MNEISKQELARRMERHHPSLLRAGQALADNDLQVAESTLRPYLKQHPTDVRAIRMMAELAARVGRVVDAENLLRRAIELAPEFTAARINLAALLHKQNRPLEAIAELERVEGDQDSSLSHASLKAAVMSRIGRMEEALALYRQVLESRPREPKVWMSYGHILKTIGEQAECIAAYRKSVEIQPTLGEAWWSLANLKTVRFDRTDIDAMQTSLEQSDLANEDRFHLHFALGKALEDAGDPELSFHHYAQGNQLRRSDVSFDAETIGLHVAQSTAILTKDFFSERSDWGCKAPDPIFVLGLPRAGSTLLEQILSTHPAIEGTAELPDMPTFARRLRSRGGKHYPDTVADLTAAELEAFGEEYLERASVQRFTDKPYFIDKLPNNWPHVGLIRLMLPNAKVIDARRHPLACGFSNFKQHYARGQHWAYDQEEIGTYYRLYVTLMRHFDAVIPGFVHRVIHEELVDDTEKEVRRLFDFLGVPFDPACLAFHENPRAVRTASSEQVRRPISRDGLEQWKPFEPWLDPLKDALGTVLQDWHR